MVVPMILIGLFAATIAILIIVGIRQRPQLQLPPPEWPPVLELPADLKRLRVRLFVLGLSVYGLGAGAFVTLHSLDLRLAANIVGGLALLVYFGLLAARITVSTRFYLRARRAGAGSHRSE